MNLAMIYNDNVWQQSGDADTVSASVRKYNKTHDHFNLNAYLKMRVFLAAQVQSQNTITMLKQECDNEELKNFAPMIQIFEAVDRLVDIMNGVGYKNCKDKNVELIDCPYHYHMTELFDILKTFEQWKMECGGFNKKS